MSRSNGLGGRPHRSRIAIAIGLSALAALALAPSAGAALIVPTVATDDITTNGNCTLREAVQASHTNTARDQCPAGDSNDVDVIGLSAALYQLSLPAVAATPDDNLEGDLDVDPSVSQGPLTLTELGAPSGEAEIDGTGPGNADRVIDNPVGSGSSLTLFGIRLDDGTLTGAAGGGGLRSLGTTKVFLQKSRVTNSSADSLGGGILVAGDLSLVESSVTGNTSTAEGGAIGGGIQSGGNLTIDSSTLSNNHANPPNGLPISTFGGGIAAKAGSVTITDSTISGNTMSDAGGSIGGVGLFAEDIPVTIRRSTFSSNTVSGTPTGTFGGAILYENSSGDTELQIENSTFAGNLGSTSGIDRGGAFYVEGGAVSVVNSTFLPNTADEGKAIRYNDLDTAGSFFNVHGSLFDELGDVCGGPDPVGSIGFGFNIERGTDCGFTASGDQQNTDANPGALGNNGGPTQTAALAPTSDAVGVIPPDSCFGQAPPVGDRPALGDDQRGAPRPAAVDEENCDVGAYELDRCNNVIVNVVGTPASDDITGTASNESILALGGNDVINGGPGQDTICAGDGNDTIAEGEDGTADTWFGGTGTDLVHFPATGSNGATIDLNTGGLAQSSVSAGDTNLLGLIENAQGGAGADTLTGNGGPNTLTGGLGGDTLVGNGGVDLLVGDFQNQPSGGPDSIFARDGLADVVDCGPATDTAQTDRLSLDSVTACESVDALAEPPNQQPAAGAQQAPAAQKRCRKGFKRVVIKGKVKCKKKRRR
jgi:hypothetical protein